MGEVTQINIKNRKYDFYNDMININNFQPNLLKLTKSDIKKHRYLQQWIYCNLKN